MSKSMEQCHQCKAIPKNDENLRYCIKCGESVCIQCRIEYFCMECHTDEEKNNTELELTAKIKYILVHLHTYMVKSEYRKFIQMIKYWFNRRMFLGDEIFDELKGIYCSELCKAFEAIRHLIIYDIDLPLDITLPEKIYRRAIWCENQ